MSLLSELQRGLEHPLWHFLCWHCGWYLEPDVSSQRWSLAPVSPHPLSPNTSLCPAFSCASPPHDPNQLFTPKSLAQPWLPETVSLLEVTLSPPVVHTTHEPSVDTSCEKIPSQDTRGVLTLTGLNYGHSSQCSIVTLGTVHCTSNQGFCADLAT